MNTNHKIIGTALAVLAGTAMIATPAAVLAHSPHRWEICPAADTVALCAIVRPTNLSSGSAGSQDAHLPAADGTAVSTGDANDNPGHGPVNPADPTTDWVDSIGAGCRRVPWHQIVACPN